MKLDVGPPREVVQLANGNLMEGRDELGLVMIPDAYAKKSCNKCYGRGVLTFHTPISSAVAAKAIEQNPANEALLHHSKPGKYAARRMEKCSCVPRQYRKAFLVFAEALVKEGLAKATGVRSDEHGDRWPTVQLV